MSKQTPFFIIAAALFIGLVVPYALQDGMFLDGVFYSAIAKNFAHGHGTFWYLSYTETMHRDFHEQLPLFFAIESLFFKVLGDGMYTERIFSILMGIVSAFMLITNWRAFYKDDKTIRDISWLPVILWICTPVVLWTYANNLQETLMSVFALGASLFIIKALKHKTNVTLNLIIAGIFTFLCSFCKGFQGLFPLVMVGAYWLAYRDIPFKKMLGYSAIVALVPVVIYSAFMLNEYTAQSIITNLERRVLNTFTNPTMATTSTRFHLIWTLFQEILIPLGLGALVLMISVRYLKEKVKLDTNSKKHALFFLLIALSGSLPLMVTLEQRNFYLVTSFPFYTLSIAVIIAPFCGRAISEVNTKSTFHKLSWVLGLLLLLASIGLSINGIGKTKRDMVMVHDVKVISQYINDRQTIGFSGTQAHNYRLHAYFMRYGNLSLAAGKLLYDYYVSDGQAGEPNLSNYQQVDLNLMEYKLYQRKEHD